MRSVKQKQAAAALVRELGFAFTINVVLHRANLDRIGEIIELAAELGADRLELANTQYYGWGLAEPGGADADAGAGRAPREAIAEDGDRSATGAGCRSLYVLPDYYEQYPKPCYGGWGKHYLVVTPERHGAAVPWRDPDHRRWPSTTCGTTRWSGSGRSRQAFQAFRGDDWMKEPCRSCPRKAVDFGGCRCQAFALTGDAANTDPVCTLTPLRHIVDEAHRRGRRRRVGVPRTRETSRREPRAREGRRAPAIAYAEGLGRDYGRPGRSRRSTPIVAPGPWSACWAPTVPARRRRCYCWRRCSRPRAARRACSATTLRGSEARFAGGLASSSRNRASMDC